MKKVLAIIIAAVLVLSCNMTAFANISGLDKDGEIISGSPVGDAQYVKANASGDDLTVTGNVLGDPNFSNHSVSGTGGAKITVEGEVAENDGQSAIHATNGASVTVEKDVKEKGANHAIYANNSTVEIKGNVEEQDRGDAISVYDNAQVSVKGDVKQDGDGYAINTCESSGSTVLVEGTVTGNITNPSGNNLYIGKLSEGSEIEPGIGIVHYLIGTANGSALPNTDFTIIDGNELLKATDGAFDTVEGVEKDGKAKKYYCTNTADPNEFKNKIITLSSDKGEITVSGLEGADAQAKTNADGTASILFGENFKGGLQNLMVTIKEIFTAVFDADGGSPEPDSQKVKEGDKVQKPSTDPTKDGYTFRYWAADGTAYDFERAVDGDITLVAVWDKNSSRSSSSSGSSKTLFTGNTGNPVTNGKWTKNADGTWSYATTSKFANTWGCIANPNDAGSAAWYYFDRNGNMLTGWQKLYWNGAYRWYYFSQTKDSNEGKCQLGGITPDGWTVDESGAWVESIPKK